MLIALALLLVAQAPSVQEAETQAQQALAAGRKGEALQLLEVALRTAEDFATKGRLRQAYLDVGWTEPPPVSLAEGTLIQRYILNEKVRVFGAAAKRLEGADQPHGAILLRRHIMELTGPGSGRAKTEQERIDSIVRKLTEGPSEEDKETVAKLLRSRKEGRSLIKAGRTLLERGRFKAAVRLCQEIMFGQFDQEIQNQAIALRREAEAKAAGDVTVAERKEARQVISDERFDRLDVVRSRHFLFLGPAEFVHAIPPQERMLLDLAYIFQSDLAAQPLTGDGVRICVYYQETFDFAGALAGGRLIRVGNRAIRHPVAEMLHYHELGHCIFGRGWLHHGFTEGLADFAAGFTLDALGQTPRAQQFITNARDQFVRFFLGRAVRYFHIQSYRPSAGFLFSFLPPGEAPYDWTPYRKAFRRMREAQFGSWPEREHQIMRYFGYLMAAEYGAAVYDTLAEWGWPVSREDIEAVPVEAEELLPEVKQGDYKLSKGLLAEAIAHYEGVLAAAPSGPLAPRAEYGLARVALALGDEPRARTLMRDRLGIVEDLKLLGAFHARRRTAHVVFPPETGRIEHDERALFGIEGAHWKPAKVRSDGYVDLRQQGYGYPAHACAFALTYVHAPAPGKARIWTGSADGHALYLNGRLEEKRDTSRRFRFDDDFVDVRLEAGWNRILLKVHNSSGPWGFLLRVTDGAGRPIPGLRISSEDHEAHVPDCEPPQQKRVGLVSDSFRTLSSSRWIATVGRFDTQNGRLRQQGTTRHGLWQRFQVDPDKPREGPAGLIWLRGDDLARLDSFELELAVAASGETGLPAKFGITVDGENGNDGQSGHTLVIDAADGKARCHWYRYDRMLYLQPGVEIPPAEIYRVSLRRVGSKWWLSINDVPLFDRVDAPRLPALGVGLLTWGRQPEFESFGLSRSEPLKPAPPARR